MGLGMTEKGGYIKLYRRIRRHPLFADQTASRLDAWCDLLMSAEWSDTRVRVNGKMLDLLRGQTARSIRFLAARWKWSNGKVSRFLAELEAENMVEQSRQNLTTVISIVNYDAYQSDGTPTEHPTTRPRTDGVQKTEHQTGHQTEHPPSAPNGTHETSYVGQGKGNGTADGTLTGTPTEQQRNTNRTLNGTNNRRNTRTREKKKGGDPAPANVEAGLPAWAVDQVGKLPAAVHEAVLAWLGGQSTEPPEPSQVLAVTKTAQDLSKRYSPEQVSRAIFRAMSAQPPMKSFHYESLYEQERYLHHEKDGSWLPRNEIEISREG